MQNDSYQRMSKGATLVLVAVWLGGCSVYDSPGGGAGTSGSVTASTGGGDGGHGGVGGSGAGGDSVAAGGGGADSSGVGGSSDVDAGGGAAGEGPIEGGGLADAGAEGEGPGVFPSDAADGTFDDRPGGLTCALYALQFGGFQGYVRVNRPVQDDFTLEAWIKASTPGLNLGTNFWQGSGLLYADAAGDANDFGASVLGSKFAFGVGNPNTTIVSASDVTSGAWVHVAATRSKGTGLIQVFVNGNMETAKMVAQVNSLTAQPNLTIGGNAMDNRYFTGFIDEVRAWNIVRSPADIKATMNHRLTGAEPGLVGYWRFDEGTGTTAADSSLTPADAAKNNGDLFGPINWVASDAPVCP